MSEAIFLAKFDWLNAIEKYWALIVPLVIFVLWVTNQLRSRQAAQRPAPRRGSIGQIASYIARAAKFLWNLTSVISLAFQLLFVAAIVVAAVIYLLR